MKKISTRRLILAALLTALTTVATMVIKLPTPTMGYIHPGDALVLLSGFLLGPLAGGLAAGLGSMFADLLGGYFLYAPATFVIKALSAGIEAGAFGLLQCRLFSPEEGKEKSSRIPAVILSGILGELFMVVGYFVFEIFLLGLSAGEGLNASTLSAGIVASAAGVPFNLVQGIVGVVLSTILYPILRPLIRAGQE